MWKRRLRAHIPVLLLLCLSVLQWSSAVPELPRRGEGERRAPGKVAYGIMVYQRKGKPIADVFHQFKRLFDALYSEEFTYVVHVDIKSEPGLLDAIGTYLDARPNAFQIPSVSVSWAGVTVVERTLALMQKALEVDPDWEYFVNIGQDDYPLTSAADIQNTLARHPLETNFIYCWDLAGHDFFGQWERHDRRVTKVFIDYFDGKAQEMVKTFRKPPEEYQFYKSLQQTVLSRSFVHYACYSSESRRLLLFLANSQAPDEIFFPTLLFTDPQYSNRATCNSTLHLSHWIRPGGSWHPEYLSALHLPLILDKRDESLDGGPLFARKVDESKGSRRLLDVLDRLRDCPNAREREGMDWMVPLLFDKLDAKAPSAGAKAPSDSASVSSPDKVDKCDLEALSAMKRFQDGELLTGPQVMRSLDKARRVHDADVIMAFIAEYERRTGHLIRPWKHHAHTPPPLPSKAATASNQSGQSGVPAAGLQPDRLADRLTDG